jgi:uncharacterized membrane protein YbhN (UPF0104 family)
VPPTEPNPFALVPKHKAKGAAGVSRLQWLLSVLLTLGCCGLLWYHWPWLTDALGLIVTADRRWLVAAFGLEAAALFLSGQVLRVGALALGHRLGALRMWALATVALTLSQSIPVGAVGSYAVITQELRRLGVPDGQAALVATLEALCFVAALVLVVGLSLVYMLSLLGTRTGLEVVAALVAAAVGLIVIGAALYVIYQPPARLRRGLVALARLLPRRVRPEDTTAWATRLIAEVVEGRALLRRRWRIVAPLVLIQMAVLLVHSVALACVLRGFGVALPFGAIVATYGVELITSTFNVLPGGGGTVETALIAVLTQLGSGPAAVPAVVVFRLFNYWAVLPVAAACLVWLRRA